MKPIICLGEARGENEAKINSSLVGASGVELIRMLGEAKVIELTSADYDYINRYYNTGDPQMMEMVWQLHPEVYRANVFNQHPPGNRIEAFCGPKSDGIPGFGPLVKAGYVRKEFQHELERLGDEIIAIDPNLIIALGNTPLWSLSNRTGISKLRGTTALSTHTVADYKYLCTYHPAAVLRQWDLRPVTIADLSKAAREAEYPEIRRPNCEIWIEPTLDDLEAFYERYISLARILAVDIETVGNRITCIGFAPRRDVALVIPFDDARAKGRSFWPDVRAEGAAWAFVRRVLEDRTIAKVFQNGLYDIAFLWRSVGIRVLGAEEDSMLLHHALQPEALKGLGFLGSIYSSYGAWKTERRSTTIKRDE